MKQSNKNMALLFIFFFSLQASAQFFSVDGGSKINSPGTMNDIQLIECSIVTPTVKYQKAAIGTVNLPSPVEKKENSSVKNGNKQKGPKQTSPTRPGGTSVAVIPAVDTRFHSLPLTFDNLLLALRYYGIHHRRIVMGQAILETGWMRSNVCRTKNNLFGLTNPRTGEYYEFEHWSDSVRAYRTLVQYRYDGGNYYDWLDRIGYAEAPDYTIALRRIVSRHL